MLSYYRAMALKKLGEDEKAAAIFQRLVESGARALQHRSDNDFFSKFGQRQWQYARTANAHYIAGLGRLGLGQTDKAKQEFTEALKEKPDHLGAKIFLENL
jgi:tetratricopeptide (TPR) repeat protein